MTCLTAVWVLSEFVSIGPLLIRLEPHLGIILEDPSIREPVVIAIITSRVRKWIYPVLLALVGFRACEYLDFGRSSLKGKDRQPSERWNRSNYA